MERETVVGIAWAVGLVMAMAGVFAYEYATFELGDYNVAETEEVLLTETGSLQENADESFTVTVPGSDLVAVVARVTWTDDVGDPDTFEVTIRGPDGFDPWSDGSSSGNLAVRAEVAPATFDNPVEAVDEADAVAQTDHEAPYSGDMDWTITVRLQSAPGAEVVPGVPVGATADGSNSFTLEVVAIVLSATAVP